jgi:hypothetical protein
MIRNGGKPSGGWVMPDFMASCRMTKKLKAKCLEFLDNLPIFESR